MKQLGHNLDRDFLINPSKQNCTSRAQCCTNKIAPTCQMQLMLTAAKWQTKNKNSQFSLRFCQNSIIHYDATTIVVLAKHKKLER